MRPLQQLPLSSFQAPKPLLTLLRPPKGLERLVTKARGWKWLRARKRKLYQRLRAQQLTEARKLLPRQRGPSLSSFTLWPRKRRSAWARLLILLSPGQLAKNTLLQPRLSLGFFFFHFFFFCTFILLWQFATVYDVSFFCSMKRH